MAEVRLNEIIITPKAANTTLALRSPLYDIESTNTIESRIQSVSTATGNEHIVQKFSNESLIATKVPSGTFELIATTNQKNQVGQLQPLIFVTLKP